MKGEQGPVLEYPQRVPGQVPSILDRDVLGRDTRMGIIARGALRLRFPPKARFTLVDCSLVMASIGEYGEAWWRRHGS